MILLALLLLSFLAEASRPYRPTIYLNLFVAEVAFDVGPVQVVTKYISSLSTFKHLFLSFKSDYPKIIRNDEMKHIESFHSLLIKNLKKEKGTELLIRLQILDESVRSYILDCESKYTPQLVKGLKALIFPVTTIQYNYLSSDCIPYQSCLAGGVPSFELLFKAIVDGANSFHPILVKSLIDPTMVVKSVIMAIARSTSDCALFPIRFWFSLYKNAYGYIDGILGFPNALFVEFLAAGVDIRVMNSLCKRFYAFDILSVALYHADAEQTMRIMKNLQPFYMHNLMHSENLDSESRRRSMVTLFNGLFFRTMPPYFRLPAFVRYKTLICILDALPEKTIGARVHSVLLPWVRGVTLRKHPQEWTFMIQWALNGTYDDRALYLPGRSYTERWWAAYTDEIVFRQVCFKYYQKCEDGCAPPGLKGTDLEWRQYLLTRIKRLNYF